MRTTIKEFCDNELNDIQSVYNGADHSRDTYISNIEYISSQLPEDWIIETGNWYDYIEVINPNTEEKIRISAVDNNYYYSSRVPLNFEDRIDQFKTGRSDGYYILNREYLWGDENYKKLYSVLSYPKSVWTEDEKKYYEDNKYYIDNGIDGFRLDCFNPYANPNLIDRQNWTVNLDGVANDVFLEKFDFTKRLQNALKYDKQLNDPAIDIFIDEKGYAHIKSCSNDTGIVSDAPIANAKDWDSFISNHIDDIVEYSNTHLDLLFSNINMDHHVYYSDDLGEHMITLNTKEFNDYNKMDDNSKLEFLRKRVYNNVSATYQSDDEPIIYKVPIYKNVYDDGNQIYLYVSKEDYDLLCATNYFDSEAQIKVLEEKGYISRDILKNLFNYNVDNFEGTTSSYAWTIGIDFNSVESYTYDDLLNGDIPDLSNYDYNENGDGLEITWINDNGSEITHDYSMSLGASTLDFTWEDEVGTTHTYSMNEDEWNDMYEKLDGNEQSKIGSFDNPNLDYLQKIIVNKYSNNSSLLPNKNIHYISFDDGRIITLTDKQYAKYCEEGTNYLNNFSSYNESLITSVLSNQYKASFDTRRYTDEKGNDFYVVYANGEIVGNFELSSILNEEGSINPKSLYEKVEDYVKDHDIDSSILNHVTYDKNPKFEMSRYLISFDDEGEYKTIVKKLSETRELYEPSINAIEAISDELVGNDISKGNDLKTYSDCLNSIFCDTEFLDSAIKKTVRIYTACDSDLRSVFESGIVDSVFSKAGLYVYTENRKKRNREKNVDYIGNKRIDIRDDEKFLEILHASAKGIHDELEELYNKCKNWDENGWMITREMYENIIRDRFADDPDKADEILLGITDDTFRITDAKLKEIMGLGDNPNEDYMEEHCYKYLSSNDPENPSDFDEYVNIQARLVNPSSRKEIWEKKKFITMDKYFPYVMTDYYDMQLEYLRENCNNFNQSDWDKYRSAFGSFDFELTDDEIKNMEPNQLALISTIYASRNLREKIEHDTKGSNIADDIYEELYMLEPEYALMNKDDRVDPTVYIEKYYGDMELRYLYVTDDYEGNLTRRELYQREYEKLFGTMEISDDTSLKNYVDVIIGDSANNRVAREEGIKEINSWIRGGVDITDLCETFCETVFDQSMGNIYGLLDPSSKSFASKTEYKVNYLIDLLDASKNPEKAALKYSLGEISLNEFNKIKDLSVSKIIHDVNIDASKGEIKYSYKSAQTFGEVAAKYLLGKLAVAGKGIAGTKFAINTIKALNAGGKAARTASSIGVEDNDARKIGLFQSGLNLTHTYVVKKLFDKMVPDIDTEEEKTNPPLYNTYYYSLLNNKDLDPYEMLTQTRLSLDFYLPNSFDDSFYNYITNKTVKFVRGTGAIMVDPQKLGSIITYELLDDIDDYMLYNPEYMHETNPDVKKQIKKIYEKYSKEIDKNIQTVIFPDSYPDWLIAYLKDVAKIID